MDSRIYENEDDRGDPDIGRILDDADARIARLAAERVALAERRRALVEPKYKTVVTSPSDMHHKIALGAVLVNIGLLASDADALAGALALHADHIVGCADALIDANPLVPFGRVLVALIDRHDRDLTARGLYDAWARRLGLYEADRDEWLARDAEFRLEGAWRQLDMTRDQRWLMRVTCRIRQIDLPGDLGRGDCADWLEANGANMNYREFVS